MLMAMVSSRNIDFYNRMSLEKQIYWCSSIVSTFHAISALAVRRRRRTAERMGDPSPKIAGRPPLLYARDVAGCGPRPGAKLLLGLQCRILCLWSDLGLGDND